MNSSLLQQLEVLGINYPTLESLIDLCGENFGYLKQNVERKLFEAGTKIELDKSPVKGFGTTPIDAVASMYLAWINGIKP